MKTYRIFIVNRRDERDRCVYGDRLEYKLEISLEQARNRIHNDYYIEHKEVFKLCGEFRTLDEIRLLHNETTTFLQKEIQTLEDLEFEKYKIKNGIHHYTHNDTFLNIEIYLEENYYKCYGCITNELHQAIMLKMEELQNETN